MATYVTSSGAPPPAPAIGMHPAGQQDHQQLQNQVSQITLDQQQHHQAQHFSHAPQLDQPASADNSVAEPPGSADGRSNGLANIGLGGFLGKLGLDRKTNRDGQPAKRRGPKPDSKPALTRRQELNRQAQRTHRQRKEVYIKTLETEIMKFKEHLQAEAQNRVAVQEENRRLKELLLANGITFPHELHLPSPPHPGAYPGSSATSDGGLGSNNGDYATPSSYGASGSDYGTQHGPSSAVSGHTNGTVHPARQNIPLNEQTLQHNSEENQLGIDFVLALEAFCNDHQQYLHVRSSQSSGTELPVASGHALMLSCPPLSHIENNPSEPYPHQAPPMPTASLARLLETAKQLPLEHNGEITPIMALAYIQSDARYPMLRVKDLLAIQEELKGKTRCYGFGAVLEEFEVRDALSHVFSPHGSEQA